MQPHSMAATTSASQHSTGWTSNTQVSSEPQNSAARDHTAVKLSLSGEPSRRGLPPGSPPSSWIRTFREGDTCATMPCSRHSFSCRPVHAPQDAAHRMQALAAGRAAPPSWCTLLPGISGWRSQGGSPACRARWSSAAAAQPPSIGHRPRGSARARCSRAVHSRGRARGQQGPGATAPRAHLQLAGGLAARRERRGHHRAPAVQQLPPARAAGRVRARKQRGRRAAARRGIAGST